jgi:uncharacterized membrane protein
MELLIAAVGLCVLGLPLIAVLVLASLWGRVSQLRSDVDGCRAEVWGLQGAVAALDARLASPPARVSAYRVPLHEEGARALPAPGPAPIAPPAVAPAPVAALESERPRESVPSLAELPVSEPARGSSFEDWLGVRGAAALGAALLVLAGIYFFKYSIERDLLTPAMRVALGLVAGGACVATAELAVRRRHGLLASCLAGAGVAILYVACWATYARYQLVGGGVACAAMVLLTAGCSALALWRSSAAIAVFGLLGGFATPFMLALGEQRPVALFVYLLVLDAAMLLLAFRRRWPGLALLSLLATAGYVLDWMLGAMAPGLVGWGMVVSGAFAALFQLGLGAASADERDRWLWRITRATALLLPLCFALYVGTATYLGASFAAVGGFSALLIVAALVVAQRERWPWLALGAALAGLGVLAGWLVQHPHAAGAWQLGLYGVGVAVALQLAAERSRESGLARAALVWALGSLAATALLAPAFFALLPAWFALALVLLRHGGQPGRERAAFGAGACFGVALLVSGARHLADAGAADAGALVLAVLAAAALFTLATRLSSYPMSRRLAAHGSALLALALLFLLPAAVGLAPAWYYLASLGLAALVGVSVLGNGAPAWLLGAAPLVAIAQAWRWQSDDATLSMALSGPVGAAHQLGWAFHGVTALAFAAWPIALPERLRDRAWSWRVAAVAPALFFPAMLCLERRAFGAGAADAFLALGFAALPLAVLACASWRGTAVADTRRAAVTWLLAASLAFMVVAVPLAFEREWLTMAWALLGAGCFALWHRLERRLFLGVGSALLAAVLLRLAWVPAVVAYHAHGGWPIVNWLAPAYLVPAGCFLASAHLLGARRDVYAQLRTVLGAAAVLLGFVWLNLCILDAFGPVAPLLEGWRREPARDLTLSIAWALYAVALLLAGVWREEARWGAGARRAGLALMVVTCAKVSLVDLAHLRDLYRVMSLTGLALSLIVVSLAYQHLVRRRGQSSEVK